VADGVVPKRFRGVAGLEEGAGVIHDGAYRPLGHSVKFMHVWRASSVIDALRIEEAGELVRKEFSGVVGEERTYDVAWLGFPSVE